MASLPNPSPLPRLLSSRFAETIARDVTDLDDDDHDTERYPIPATLREHEELYFGVARRQLTDNQSISSVRFEQFMVEKVRRRLALLPDFPFAFDAAPLSEIAPDAAFEVGSKQTHLIHEVVFAPTQAPTSAAIAAKVEIAQLDYAHNRFQPAIDGFREAHEMWQRDLAAMPNVMARERAAAEVGLFVYNSIGSVLSSMQQDRMALLAFWKANRLFVKHQRRAADADFVAREESKLRQQEAAVADRRKMRRDARAAAEKARQEAAAAAAKEAAAAAAAANGESTEPSPSATPVPPPLRSPSQSRLSMRSTPDGGSRASRLSGGNGGDGGDGAAAADEFYDEDEEAEEAEIAEALLASAAANGPNGELGSYWPSSRPKSAAAASADTSESASSSASTAALHANRDLSDESDFELDIETLIDPLAHARLEAQTVQRVADKTAANGKSRKGGQSSLSSASPADGSLAALVRETFLAAQEAAQDERSMNSAGFTPPPRIPLLSAAAQDRLSAQLGALLMSGTKAEGVHACTAVTFSNLGAICFRLGWHLIALKAFNFAKFIRFAVLNSATPEWVDAGATLNNIGVCLHQLSRYEEALLYFNGAHQAMGVWLNKAHPRMTVTVNNADKTTAKCREVGLLGRDDALARWQVQPDELNLAVLLAMKSGGGAKKKAAGGKKKKK